MQLKKNDVVPTSSQDEALARYSVSREVPCSVLKCETVLCTLDATPNVPGHAGLTRQEHRGSRTLKYLPLIVLIEGRGEGDDRG